MIPYSSVIPSELGFLMWDPWAPSRAWMGTKKSVTLPKWKKESEVKLLSCVQLFATSWTVAYQAPPSMGFPRQEYWSGVPFPSPGDLSDPGIEPRSPTLQAEFLPAELRGKPKNTGVGNLSLLQGIFPTQELNQGLLQRWFFTSWISKEAQVQGIICASWESCMITTTPVAWLNQLNYFPKPLSWI